MKPCETNIHRVLIFHAELKELFSAPHLLKQRIVLALIYSAGLRGQEVINLKLPDVDFERMTIHIRQSKYKKDRIVPLSPTMALGLKKYLGAENPHTWLFNCKQPGSQYSIRGLSWVMRENLKKTSITKKVNLHVLPMHFVKIRRYGIYHPTTIRCNQGLQFVPEQKVDYEELISPKKNETVAERITRLTGFDPQQCPVCKKGKMVVINVIPRIRSPAGHLPTIFLSKLL